MKSNCTNGLLSVQACFKKSVIDLDLHYDAFGNLIKGENHISITHFSAIIISDETGIDMELQRNKIIRIADKFVDEEFNI
jgi:hypothetical protein